MKHGVPASRNFFHGVIMPSRPNSAQAIRAVHSMGRLSLPGDVSYRTPTPIIESGRRGSPRHSSISDLRNIFGRGLPDPSRGRNSKSISDRHGGMTQVSDIEIARIPDDCFDSVIDEFVDIVRVEGRKAFELAKCRVRSELILSHESEKGDLVERLKETTLGLSEARRELETVRLRSKALSKQLVNFARIFAGRRLDHVPDGPDLLPSVWRQLRTRVADRIRDRTSSDRVYSVLHRYKFMTRLFHSWHIEACRNSVIEERAVSLRALQAEHRDTLQNLQDETAKLRSERDSLRVELNAQLSRQERMQEKLKLFLLSKLEMFDADAPTDRPRSGPPLPAVLTVKKIRKHPRPSRNSICG
jgi:hypothetical protein